MSITEPEPLAGPADLEETEATDVERQVSVALNVLRTLDQPSSTSAAVAEAAAADPQLGQQILRMARSPLCGVRAPDLTVARAIVLLGFLSVRKLVVVSLCRDMSGTDKSVAAEWRKALWVGICAEEIAKRVDESLAPEALMVGMMRQIAGSYSDEMAAAQTSDAEGERFDKLLLGAERLAEVIGRARPGLPSRREVDDTLESAGLRRLDDGKLAVDIRRGYELYAALLG